MGVLCSITPASVVSVQVQTWHGILGTLYPKKVGLLMNEESRQRAAQPVTTPGVALAVTPVTQKTRRPLEQITCFHCGEKGHYQINCLKRKAEEKKGTAAVVFEEKEEAW